MAAEFVLGDAHFAKGSFAQLVSNSVKLMGGCNRLAHLLEVGDDHRDQVLLVLQKGVKHFCHRNFRLILVT